MILNGPFRPWWGPFGFFENEALKKRKKKKEKGSVYGVVGVVLNVKITSFQKLSQPSYLRQCKGQIEFHFNKQKINVFFFNDDFEWSTVRPMWITNKVVFF